MSQFKLRNAALATALAAVAAGTAWAATEYSPSYSDLDYDSTLVTVDTPAKPAEPLAAPESVTATETVTTTRATEPVAAAPVVERSTPVAEPPLTVEDRRLTPDQRIQALVMDRIGQARNISGLIGVESNNSVVTLTGYTITAGQARRAGSLAGSIEGVKYVQNDIRARIGGSV